MKLYFLLLHTQLYQKAFRQYLPQTTAYVTIPKFLKKKQIGAWKPVLCPWIIILYVSPLVLLEFIFLPKFLVFQIGFTDKSFTFEIRSSRFVLNFSFMSLFYSICVKNYFFFFEIYLIPRFALPTDRDFTIWIFIFFCFLKIKKKVLAVPKKFYRQLSPNPSFKKFMQYQSISQNCHVTCILYRCIKICYMRTL